MSEALEQLIRQAEVQNIEMEMRVLFAKNMDIFSRRFPAIYKRLLNHKPKNVLLKLDPNNNINLADARSLKYFYNDSPQDICRNQVDTFDKEAKVRKFNVVKSTEQNQNHFHIQGLNCLLDEYGDIPVKRIKNAPQLITNLIVTGVGLGYHVQEITQRFNIKNMLIYENCIDTFFASLHTINWKPILEHFTSEHTSIAFCLGVSPLQALAQMESTIQKVGLHSQMFSFILKHSARECEQEFIKTWIKEIRSFIGGMGYFDDERIGLAHAHHNLASRHAVFISNKTHHRKTRVLIVGNGPSLDDHEKYIKNNIDDVIVISCGTALTSLIRMGIKPDFHVEMERPSFIEDVIKLGTNEEQRKDITLLCLHTVSPKTTACFENVCYAIKPNDAGTPLVHKYYAPQKIPEMLFSNPTVTNCALSFVVSMGFEDVHLVGVDLGTSDDEKHHAKTSIYYDIEKFKNSKPKPKTSNKLIKEGNFGGDITTTHVLDNARSSMERLLELIVKSFPRFYCANTNHGVKIKNAESVALSELRPCKKGGKQKEIDDIIKNHFHRKTKNQYSEKSSRELLKKVMNIREEIKLSSDINSDEELYSEACRIYKKTNMDFDKLSHYMLRGTLNCFLGAIIENSLYCLNKDDFNKRLDLGRRHYNKLIDDIYTSMDTDLFKIDDTVSQSVRKMYQKKRIQTNEIENLKR